MQIPPDALIAPEKLTRYLLTFRPNNDKSSFLRSLGFSIDAPGVLEAAIRRHAAETEALMDEQNAYGDYFIVVGKLTGPGARRIIRSIWLRRKEEKNLRFVTLYPVKEKP